MLLSKKLWVLLASICALTISCVGSATPAFPTLSVNDLATVVAATMLAVSTQSTVPTAALPTAIPGTPVPPTFPPIAATAVTPAAIRINFLTGATAGVVSASIGPGQTQYYVLNAMQGQPMIVMVDSLNQDVTFSIASQGGTALFSSPSKRASWEGILTQTEDYYIGVYGGASTENFTLQVNTPARIQIAQGGTKAIKTGKTAGGYNVDYAAFGLQGQTMDVDLNTLIVKFH